MSKTMERILGGTGAAGNAGATGGVGSVGSVGSAGNAGATGSVGSVGSAGGAGGTGGVRPASISALVPEERLAPAGGGIPQRAGRLGLGYEEMFRLLNPYKPLTPEELERERKKERREKTFAAISDGISALSNLYFTTQYAPNAFSGQGTASQRTKERWDKLAAERNANMKAYLDGLAKARLMDEEHDAREREWERQLGLDKIKQTRDAAADARAEAKEKRDQDMHELNMLLMNNQITESEYKARVAEVEAEYAPQLEQSKISRNKAAAGASNAAASASRARARYYDNGGSSGNRYYGEFQGEKYKTQADYEKAVLDAARDAGVDIYDTEVTEKDYKGNPRKQRRVKRSIASIAAEVDEKNNQFNVEDYRRGGGTRQENSAPPLN